MIEIQIEIPEDVYQALRSMAAEKGVSLEDAVAALVRMGLSFGAPHTPELSKKELIAHELDNVPEEKTR